jgi:hypothetical protein
VVRVGLGDRNDELDPPAVHGPDAAEALANTERDGNDSALDRYRFHRDELASTLMPPVAALASLELEPIEAKAAFKQMNRAFRQEWELMSSRPALTTAAA